MANIRLSIGCVVSGSPRLAGDVVEVSDADIFTFTGGSRPLGAVTDEPVGSAPITSSADTIAADIEAVKTIQRKLEADLAAKGDA